MLRLVSKVSICLFCVGMEFLGGNGVTYKINVDAGDIICCPIIWIWLPTRACFLSMAEPDLTYEKTCYISIVFSHWWRPCSVIERKWKSYSKHLMVFCYHWIFLSYNNDLSDIYLWPSVADAGDCLFSCRATGTSWSDSFKVESCGWNSSDAFEREFTIFCVLNYDVLVLPGHQQLWYWRCRIT